VVGTSHAETVTPCQDASCCEVIETATGELIFIAVAADGAGSAVHSARGAQLACAQVIECVRGAVQSPIALAEIDPPLMVTWIEQIRQCIQHEAELANADSRAFACTLLVAIVGSDRAVFAQVGDGAMVIATEDEPHEYRWVFWPEQGEYVNTTRFITDADYQEHLQYMMIEQSVSELAVFTDGLQHLALQYEPPIAYVPFFKGLFPPVRRVAAEHMPMLSRALAVYLNAPKVNARTDDDKTLILATRSLEKHLP